MQRSAVAVAAHSAHAWDNPLMRHACVVVFRDIEGVGRCKLRWPGSVQINNEGKGFVMRNPPSRAR